MGNEHGTGRRIVPLAGVAALLAMLSPVRAAAIPSDRSFDAYEHPTDVSDLGYGRQISWTCMGHGSPTVIMTAGAGDWASTWRKVQSAVGSVTRACAWSRAGFGFSGASGERQDVRHTEADLEHALIASGIRGKFVLVGHSIGSYETLLFADRNRGKVAGIILVDPAFPDQFRIIKALYPHLSDVLDGLNAQVAKMARDCTAGVKSGSMKPGMPGWTDCMSDDPGYPETLRKSLSLLTAHPDRLETELSFVDAEAADAEEVVDLHRNYGAIPLVVLTGTVPPALPPSLAAGPVGTELKKFEATTWVKQHDQLAALSSHGRNVLVPEASHYIQVLKPEVTIKAITDVVRDAQKDTAPHEP